MAASAHKGMGQGDKSGFTVKVQQHGDPERNVEKAMGQLRKALQRDRWVSTLRENKAFVSKGEKDRTAKAKAKRDQAKALREEEADLSHDEIHRQSALKRGRTRKARRENDRRVQERHLAEQRGEVEPKKTDAPFFGDYRQVAENF